MQKTPMSIPIEADTVASSGLAQGSDTDTESTATVHHGAGIHRGTSICCDAIVVGAGPAGSTAAEHLARAGLRVVLLEEHAQVGQPDHCSGLVSPRALELAGLAEETFALRRYRQARVWGPGGGALWLRSETVQAVAIDRARFDQTLAGRAVSAGADLALGARAHHFERQDGHLRVWASTGRGGLRLRAPLLLGAGGAACPVARWLGRTRGHEVIPALKAEVTFARLDTEDVEIFVGNGLAPAWFGWLIPLPGGRARLGLGAARSPRRYFPAFLDLVLDRFGPFSIDETRPAPIPLGPARDFVDDGILLAGAAARQTKPTTGGGVYLAVRAGQLAAGAAVKALASGDTSRRALAAYEKDWHRLEGREVMVGHWLRRAFRRLSDRELDWILGLAAEPWAQDAIARLGDIDFPASLLSALLRGVARHAGLRAGQHVGLLLRFEEPIPEFASHVGRGSDPIGEAAP